MSRYLHEGDVLTTSTDPDSPSYIVFSEKPTAGCIKVFDRAALAEKYLTVDEVYRNLASHTWTVLRPNAPCVPLISQQNTQLTFELQRANAALRKVLDTAKQCGMSFKRAYDMVRNEGEKNAPDGMHAPFPSLATLYRYRDAQLQDCPLLRGAKNKGRRAPRYSQEVDDVVLELTKKHFHRPHSRWRLAPITEHLNNICHERGYISFKQTISSRYVAKVIRAHCGPDSAARRMDPKLVAAARSIGAQRQYVRMPWERVELDVVHLPFSIRTPEGELSNVCLVLAIDCASSMAVSWELAIETSLPEACLQCIRKMIYSKAEHFARLGISIDVDIHGTPGLLVMDNGPENRGERIDKLTYLGIEVQHCKSRHPQHKPYIERLNRSLKVALETLPGCTRMDGVDGRRKPSVIGEDLMDLQELERWIVRWCYESWAHQPLERLAHTVNEADDVRGRTPMERWNHFTNASGYASTLPVPMDAWRQVMLLRSVRTISRKTGITFEGLNYKGRALTELVRQVGESEVSVMNDPTDYRFLYVDLGGHRPLVVLTEEWVTEDSPAHTLVEYKRIKSDLRKSTSRHPSAQKFQKDLLERSAQAEAPRKRKTQAERNKETTLKNRQHAAVQRAVDSPLPKTTPPEFFESKDAFSFDAVPALEVLDRKSGGKR